MAVLARKINHILLVFPPMLNIDYTNNACEIPLGVASLAAYMMDKVEIHVLDSCQEGYHHKEEISEKMIRFGLSYQDITRRVEELKPELVGFSCIFSHQFPMIRTMVDMVKKLDPQIITVAGGSHPSMLPERALRTTQLDYLVIGEGELALLRLVDALSGKGSVAEIPGLAFRDNGQIRINPGTEYIKDLDQLPFPARDLFKVEEYFKINVPMATLSRSPRSLNVISSRGCPYRCGFCCSTIHWGHRYRMRSPENVLDELEALKSRFLIEEFKFVDDNLTFNGRHARAIVKGIIERKLNLQWNTPNGISPWTLNREVLELMKAAGCYEITLAIESGDPKVIKDLVGKPLDLEQTREVVKMMRELGIGSNAFFIIGFPTETLEQVMNTINYALSLDLDRCYIFNYVPLPGTPLAKLAIERGRLNADFDFEASSNYLVPQLCLSEVPPGELMKIYRSAFWKINLGFLFRHPVLFFKKYLNSLASHPEYILKIFRSILRQYQHKPG